MKLSLRKMLSLVYLPKATVSALEYWNISNKLTYTDVCSLGGLVIHNMSAL